MAWVLWSIVEGVFAVIGIVAVVGSLAFGLYCRAMDAVDID